MFSATHLYVFVCLAVGIAVQAAPSGALGLNISTRDEYDHAYDYNNDHHDEDNIFPEGLNGSDGLGAIDDALGDFEGSDLFKRTALDNFNTQLSLTGNGNADASTDASTSGGFDLSGLGDLLSGANAGADVGANVAANLGAGGSARRRELLDGLLNNLSNGVGLSGSGSADGSASALGSGDGLLGNLDLNNLFNGNANLGANVDLNAVSNKRLINEVLGQGTNLIDGLGLDGLTSGSGGGLSGGLGGDLSGGASTSTDATTDSTSTDTSASGLGSLLGSTSGLGDFALSGNSGLGLGTNFGLRSEVEKRQILENLGFGDLQLNDLLSQLGFFNTNPTVTASVSDGATISVTATPTATGTLSPISIPTGTISFTTTPTTATATAGATATADANGIAGLLSQLGLGNFGNGNVGGNFGGNVGGNFGNLGGFGANTGAGVNGNGGFGF